MKKIVMSILPVSLLLLFMGGPAMASDYHEELEWSQMESELLDGNTVEWHLDTDTEENPEPVWRISLDTEALDLLERCVMAEGGGESYECQRAIACVIVNRVLDENYPDTVEEVIRQTGQFSTWPLLKSTEASNEVKQAVREALTTAAIPENVVYFRAGYYHRWGSDFCRIDNTYFSTP